MEDSRSFDRGLYQQTLRRIIRPLALSSASHLFEYPNLSTADIVDFYGSAPDFWMSLILVAGPSMRLTLKVFFSKATVEDLAGKLLTGKSTANLERAYADIFREYCNVVAGRKKALLEKAGIKVGISLPLVTRGFDDVFTINDERTIEDHWQILAQRSHLTFSAALDIFDPAVVGQLLSISFNETDDQDTGEIEFL